MMRPLMEEAYRVLAEGGVPVVVAPTGYGKTVASPEIYRRSLSDGLAAGLVHVAPLRSLVKKVYRDVFKPHGGGYQMHEAPGESPDKSPYFLRGLVVTTLDSYLWNMYRIPVAEAVKLEERLSMGHYYPIAAAALTSVNVFDEAHLYLDEALTPGVGVDAVRVLVETLAGMNSLLVVETATLRPSTLAGIAGGLNEKLARWGRRARILALPCQAKMLSGHVATRKLEVAGVEDEEWVEASTLEWHTRITGSWDTVLPEMARLQDQGLVLAVSNTVSGAIDLYRRLQGMGIEELLLIHGRLSEEDRARAEEKLGDMRTGVVVATQVVEAGVDVNSIAVYTEAAPLESLVQRAGRACRRGRSLEYCRSEGARLTIVDTGEYTVYDEDETRRALGLVASREGRVDWRLPCDRQGYTGYATLIHEADTPPTGGPILQGGQAREEVVASLLRAYLENDGRPWALLDILKHAGLCSLYRQTAMVSILVDDAQGTVTASLDWALANAGKILQRGHESGAPLVKAWRVDGEGAVIVEASNLWSAWQRERARRARGHGGNCHMLYNSLKRDITRAAERLEARATILQWGFLAAPGAYQPGIGLAPSNMEG